MKSVAAVMKELKKKGNPQRVKVYGAHGAPENIYGVSVADLKIIAKAIKGHQDLALDLYETGNADAMYLAGIVADGSQMTKKTLDAWARKATWQLVSEYSVPGVATESKHALALGKKWISARKESVASSGWNTLSGVVTVTPDDELDLAEVEGLLDLIETEIDGAPNRVRYTMNGFVIAVGCYVKPLNKRAKATAKKLGKVEVAMHGTSCKVPLATDYIKKVETAGRLGKKRKTIKC